VAAPDAVLKVGGSLGERPKALARLMAALADLARARTLVVVPGGGRFADEVRRADRRFGLGDPASHWMAILAMDQSAYLLTQLAGAARLIREPAEIGTGRLNVLAPSSWLRRADRLPRSWEVTSDSIAAWIARQTRARMLVLLKDVDGVFERDPKKTARARLRLTAPRDRLTGVVDGYFARALGRRTRCWIVNGRYPERVAALLETGRTYGTELAIDRARGRALPRVSD
jgi:hypothetical protein